MVNRFEVELVWRQGRECDLRARENPPLVAATPPEFGGPEGVWSPEELLVASVGSCLLSTFLYFVDRFDVPLRAYVSAAHGTLDRTREGLRFTHIDVSMQVTVPDGVAADRLQSLHLQEKLEKYCPVSASLACPVHLQLDVRQEQAAGGSRA